MIKSLLSFIIILFISFSNLAQTTQDEVQLMQSLYGMEKRDIIGEFIELNESQEEEFWKIYDEYELKRQEIGKERIDF